ncbi:methyltransferase type 11 [Chlorogloeopsis fritschii PCC 6912]|uniref:Methyltransferase type 11 n=2 Tax=Chlorogloeopsis fritschii TaxID=1124 RepID=A0A3S0Y6T0_CHLFR|nr:methyltransferase type 11 [Chlorogloeopsis fritschii PCC 6912]
MGKLLLKSIVRLLIGEDRLLFYETIDWQHQSDRFRKPELVYPHYYSSQNFHGIENGYLNRVAAITYDPVAAFASPPNEAWIRQQLIAAIECQPTKILDLGCGTGSTTLMLKQAFPQAVAIGLDLSPYMLVVADYKARQAGLNIQWQHGLAENTGLEEVAFDLVTVSFLLHETPPKISQLILRECFRLIKPGGQVIVLDGNQKRLRHANWLIKIFKEPYSKAYAAESVDEWMRAAGFVSVQTEYVGWIDQLTRGTKAIAVKA